MIQEDTSNAEVPDLRGVTSAQLKAELRRRDRAAADKGGPCGAEGPCAGEAKFVDSLPAGPDVGRALRTRAGYLRKRAGTLDALAAVADLVRDNEAATAALFELVHADGRR